MPREQKSNGRARGPSNAPPKQNAGKKKKGHKLVPTQKERGSAVYNKAKRRVVLLNCFFVVLGLGVCGLGYYIATSQATIGINWIVYLAGTVGLALFGIAVVGGLGAWRENQSLLLLYITVLLVIAMAVFVCGGFCLILIDQAVASINNQWALLLAQGAVTGTAASAESFIRTTLTITGVVCLLMVPLFWYVIKQVMNMVTVRRAAAMMLQLMTMMMLPLGMGITAAGVYVMETAAYASASITALIIFGLGILVVFLSLLGCFGSAIEGRKMVSLFGTLVSLLSVVFLGVGITSFVQAATLQDWVVSNWDQVRQALPPTFTGRYDKEYFKAFLSSNIKGMGFMCVCVSVFLETTHFMSFMLGNVLELISQRRKTEIEHARRQSVHMPTNERKKYVKGVQERFAKGSKSQRMAVKFTCCACCCLLFIVGGLGTAMLVFQAFCTTISSVSNVTSYTGAPASVTSVYVENNYGKGLTKVQRLLSGGPSFELNAAALNAELASTKSELLYSNSNASFVGAPTAGTLQVFQYDLACQSGAVTVGVPPPATTMSLVVNSSSTGGVEINQAASDQGTYESLKTFSGIGQVAATNLRIGSPTGPGVFTADTTSGDLVISGLQANCAPEYTGSASAEVRLTTELGVVELLNTKLVNCMLNVSGGAAPIIIDGYTGSSIAAGVKKSSGVAKVASQSGRVNIKNFVGDTLSVVTRTGAVEMTGVNAGFVRVGSVDGAVNLKQLFPVTSDNNNLQVETTGGTVNVDIQPDGFKGEYTLWSSTGFVSVMRNGAVLPPCVQCTSTCSVDPAQKDCRPDGRLCDLYCASNNGTNLATGRIGCYDSACGYYGEILITSDTGNINLVLNV